VGETHTRTCGRCIYCKTGNQHVCISKRAPGWGIDGAFAEFISYPSRLLHKIPDGVHWDDAALAEPVAICCHAIAERALRQGSDLTSSVGNEVACVIGPGPIGLISLQLLKSLGVSKCIVLGTERSAKLRLKTAEMLGADVIINVDREDAVKTISDITSGLGADIVIETSGSERGILMAGRLARRMGTVCHLGISGKESLQIHHDEYIFKALTVVYSFSHRYTSWETALGLIKRSRIDTSRLITHRAPLKEWRELFELIERREAIKAVIKPHSS
jgi:threonine dehydrogenase-like Zn-dependent dehydrogenase